MQCDRVEVMLTHRNTAANDGVGTDSEDSTPDEQIAALYRGVK